MQKKVDIMICICYDGSSPTGIEGDIIMKKQISEKLDRVSEKSLLEKQSVRTTFKLSESGLNANDWLIKKSSLKPKELFDLICSNETVIDLAIKEARKNKKSKAVKQTRRTFVISTRVKRMLNKLSKEHELSRDLIFENLIVLFQMLLKEYSEDERQKEKKAHAIISDFWGQAEAVEQQLKGLLGDGSPILERFGFVIAVVMNLTSAIESKWSNGVPIDPDDMSQS